MVLENVRLERKPRNSIPLIMGRNSFQVNLYIQQQASLTDFLPPESMEGGAIHHRKQNARRGRCFLYAFKKRTGLLKGATSAFLSPMAGRIRFNRF
jgi:hypothetical protein